MSEPTVEEVVSIVSSVFEVTEMQQNLDKLQFKIKDEQFKSKFVDLAQRLEDRDLACKIEKLPDGLYVLVMRFPARKQRKWLSKTWTPRILFAVVIGFVMFDGHFRTASMNKLFFIGEPLEMAAIYTLALLGILGIHESGHLIAARYHKLKTSWPYFIPGIPVIGIPTFGAFIQSRGLTINREILFDVAIAGPIAGLIVAIIVSFFAAYTAPVISDELSEELFKNQELVQWELGEPLLLKGALAFFGKGGEGQEVLLTPLLFASWVGFLITFLNLLPAWQLDGGHMSRTLMGAKWHRIATYASIVILIWPLRFEFMAILILFMSFRVPSAQPLDDISPLPKNRKIAYIGIIILAILCAPLPSSLLS